MTTIGEILKNARLEQNYSLTEMQAQTKIQEKYLQAIEAGDINALPGQFYYSTFVKQYAQALGLDGDALLAQDLSNVSGSNQASELKDQPISEESSSINPQEESSSVSPQAERLRSPRHRPVVEEEEEPGVSDLSQADEESSTSVSFDSPLGYEEKQPDEEKVEPSSTGVVIEHPAEEEYKVKDQPAQTSRQEDVPSRTNKPELEDNDEDFVENNPSCFERYGCAALVILLVIVGAALFYFFISQDASDDQAHLDLSPDSEQLESGSAGQEAEDEAASNQEETEEPSSLPQAQIEQVEADGSNGVYSMNSQGADQIKVEVASTVDEAWVSVSADGQLYRQAILGLEEVMEVNLDANVSSIEFAVGQADGTEIRINGSVLEFPAENEGNPTQYLTIDVD